MTPLRFSTRDIPVPARRLALSQLRERGLLPLEPVADSVPRVTLVKWRLPGASVLTGTFAGVRQGGDTCAGDELFFAINLTGRSTVHHRGGRFPLDVGEAFVAAPGAGTFHLVRGAPAGMIGVRLPRRCVPVEDARLSSAGLQRLPAETPALRLLARYLREAVHAPLLASPPLTAAIVGHVAELIALSLEPAGIAAGGDGVRAARLAAIKSDIDGALTDPSLTVATLAGRHGISSRYLHKLFESETTTYSHFVLERRLSLAYRLLTHPRFAARTVSSIAHDSGFGDLSYFNRTFRRRYDATPTEVRRASVH